MKGLWINICREFKIITRDGISIALLGAPALLSVIMLAIFGQISGTSAAFVTDNSLTNEQQTRLEAVGDVEYVDDFLSLEKRIKGMDSVAGVYSKDGKIYILTEGNEEQGFDQGMSYLVSKALAQDPVGYVNEEVVSKTPMAYDIAIVSVILLAMFIGGSLMGLNGVAERETKVIHAYSISPIGLWGFVAQKLISATIYALLSVAIAALIMGKTEMLLMLLLVTLFSTFFTGFITFITPAMAENQVSAVGVMKLLMPLSMIIGISSVFVPDKWHFLYYLLPMYWQYTAIQNVLDNKGAILNMILTAITAIPWFIAAVMLFSKKTNMVARRNK
ncbi:MAG: ABC transporter permease [Clostridia bacterium]|jgi:ABC-2 type transport system permease protein|nr:ABC transporter permease [Clostridia bacterium]MDD4502197.1 ABC transporter permease [Clostridia bacterium]HPB16879.1 ABC transporter permease [Clostridia bacterium]HQM95623.1 ABC transporter permease [Clostridia bacterium]HQO69160.1 ABC transporter permease [Clostridia bacterium]